MNDELVWLEQSCRSFLQTSAALFSVDKLLHIDVALYSGGSLLENHKLDTLRFFIVRLPQQIHENGLSITLVVNFNMISTHTRVKAAADRRAKRLAPLIRHQLYAGCYLRPIIAAVGSTLQCNDLMRNSSCQCVS